MQSKSQETNGLNNHPNKETQKKDAITDLSRSGEDPVNHYEDQHKLFWRQRDILITVTDKRHAGTTNCPCSILRCFYKSLANTRFVCLISSFQGKLRAVSI